MSRQSASVHFEGVTDGEHPHDGADVSGDHCLSFENPIAIEIEIREELAREDEEERGGAAVNRNSLTSLTVRAKKANKSKTNAVICTVIAVIWGLLTLPTIYFHMPQV